MGDVTPVSGREPMFTFRTSSVRPAATVTCKHCGWTAKGNDPNRVFPQADKHTCRNA